jgi:hypothetical protein
VETNSDGKRLERLEAHVAELTDRVENGPFTPGVPRMVVAGDARAGDPAERGRGVTSVANTDTTPAVGSTVTVLYPGSMISPGTTRVSVVKYISAGGTVYVRCAETCGACGPAEGDGNHRVGMFKSRILPGDETARNRRCHCAAPIACATAFPARCPF